MRESTVRRWLTGAVFGAALGLSAASHAVVYSSTFDPPNFSGTATFDVAPGCLTTDGFHANDGSSCTVTWLTATVTFQDTPNHTFTYAPLLPDSTIVSSIYVVNGDLAGVISGALGPHIISGHVNPSYDGPWWIQYQFSPPSRDLAVALDGPPSSGAFGLGVVYLYTGECFGPPEPFCARNDQPSEVADVESFTRVTQVPEPGTLALALAALAGALAAGRRRRGFR